MSADRFRRALSLMNLSENERIWYPRWVEGYAGFHSMREIWEHGVGELRLDHESVMAYLRSLRDSRTYQLATYTRCMKSNTPLAANSSANDYRLMMQMSP